VSNTAEFVAKLKNVEMSGITSEISVSICCARILPSRDFLYTSKHNESSCAFSSIKYILGCSYQLESDASIRVHQQVTVGSIHFVSVTYLVYIQLQIYAYVILVSQSLRGH
jgi:hypothetical protein